VVKLHHSPCLLFPITELMISSLGWPEPYIHTVRLGIFGREITIHTVVNGVYVRFWPTLLVVSMHIHTLVLHNGRIFGDFSAKTTVYAPYLYGYGQP